MKQWIAALAAAGLVAVAACGGGEETENGGADTGAATGAPAGGLETQPPGGPTADTTGAAAGPEAMGGDTAVPPNLGH